MRAVRIDKMTLAALEATLRHYQRDQAETHIPVWRMISTRPEQLAQRAANWSHQLTAAGIAAHTQLGGPQSAEDHCLARRFLLHCWH